MRKNFYEILKDMRFDFRQEYTMLLNLFQTENSVAMRGYYHTLSEFIEEKYFRSLPWRGTITSIDQMMKAIPIKQYATSLEDLFVLSEFLIAILPEEMLRAYPSIKEQSNTIKDNIKVILEKTNHELIKLPGNNEAQIIVEKNRATTHAMEIVEDSSIAMDLLEYNHFALKGDLDKKRKILTSLGGYIEPILKSRVLQNSGYKQLESDTGFVLNNFNIRHNNKTGAKAQDYVVSCSDKELEVWYDKAYNMLVAVIIINEHIAVQQELNDLKHIYSWKS